jgi:adenine-specific DNA methylase
VIGEVPSAQKVAGAYYTPPEIAEALVRWAIRRPDDRVLDPACGEAVFLRSAVVRLRSFDAFAPLGVNGFELDRAAAGRARSAAPEAHVTDADFFKLEPEPAYDAVVGNPPWVRYHYFSGETRERALSRALASDVSLSGLTSSWAPFLVHAAAFLKPEGRLAMVLPAELLTTDYAAAIRDFLTRRFAHVHICTFEKRVFPGALVDAVLVFAEGRGPGVVTVQRLDHVAALQGHGFDTAVATEATKWSDALIDQQALKVLADAPSSPLGAMASVDIGIVTGANQFFVVDTKTIRQHDIPRSALRPALARGRSMSTHAVDEPLWRALDSAGSPAWLFHPDELTPEVLPYITHGENMGHHRTYKCSIRDPWWRLRLPAPPDLILTYMSNHTVRIASNPAGVLTTNLLHNVRLTSDAVSPDILALSWGNSATMLSCELRGRAYGGGVLKLETKEAEAVAVPPIPDEAAAELRNRSGEIDALLAEGNHAAVADLVDPIVLADLAPTDRKLLREAWLDLQTRRQRRQAPPTGEMGAVSGKPARPKVRH